MNSYYVFTTIEAPQTFHPVIVVSVQLKIALEDKLYKT